MSAGPREALGLPDPDTLRLEDPELLAVYREFADGLALAHEDDVVYADPELFSFHGATGTIAVERYPRLRLLAALLGPDDELHQYIRARTHAPDDFGGHRGRPSGHRHTLGVAHALEAFRTATTTRDHSRFLEGRAAPACLDHLSMELSSGPGMTWFADVKIQAWSADWAIVLFYPDIKEGEGAVFPKILGFARRDRYPQSAGRLLAGLPEHYRVSADAEVDGPNLLSACWMRHGDEGEFDLGELLLGLDDETLDALVEEYGDLGSDDLYGAIGEIQEFVWEYWPEKDGDDIVRFALSQYGGITAVGSLAGLLRALEEDRERLEAESERRREEAKRQREAEARARYDAAPARGPEDFGAHVTVDQLSEEDRLSLQKWMEQECGLTGSEVTYRPYGRWGFAGYQFVVAFEHGGQRRTASFRDPFPAVAAAFREALALAAAQGKARK